MEDNGGEIASKQDIPKPEDKCYLNLKKGFVTSTSEIIDAEKIQEIVGLGSIFPPEEHIGKLSYLQIGEVMQREEDAAWAEFDTAVEENNMQAQITILGNLVGMSRMARVVRRVFYEELKREMEKCRQ